MSIIDRIDHMRIDFILHTGTRPTAIYLGYGYKAKLQLLVDSCAKVSMDRKNIRMQFMGLPVYIVDEEEYIGIGR